MLEIVECLFSARLINIKVEVYFGIHHVLKHYYHISLCTKKRKWPPVRDFLFVHCTIDMIIGFFMISKSDNSVRSDNLKYNC